MKLVFTVNPERRRYIAVTRRPLIFCSMLLLFVAVPTVSCASEKPVMPIGGSEEARLDFLHLIDHCNQKLEGQRSPFTQLYESLALYSLDHKDSVLIKFAVKGNGHNSKESHIRAIVMENRVRQFLGQTQCRPRHPNIPETLVPHADHVDRVFKIGGHTERLHIETGGQRSINYEAGSDVPCNPNDRTMD